MDHREILPLIDNLSDDIAALEAVFAPVLETGLDNISSQLPLLERAKMNVLMNYSIEALLFSALRLSGVDAKQHPIYAELARVRSYFEKIKIVEDASLAKAGNAQQEQPDQRKMTVDKEAATRIVQHGIASETANAMNGLKHEGRAGEPAKKQKKKKTRKHKKNNAGKSKDEVDDDSDEV